MNIVVTGATGFIGRYAISYLQGKGHSITALVRNIERAKDLLGGDVEIADYDASDDYLVRIFELADVVLHLAGSPVATRWTKRKKEELKKSRVGICRRLVDIMDKCQNRPSVFISASAIGYYGNRGKEFLDETSKKGTGFLADLCDDWENTARKAETGGTKVCFLRIVIVLGREGGFLEKITPFFQMNLGNYLGGDKFISWIHIVDLVRIINICIEENSLYGPINCTSPSPVTNKEFAAQLAKITKCRLLFRTPTLIFKLLFGEASSALTGSQHVYPQVLIANGFKFKFCQLENALSAEFSSNNVKVIKYNRDSSNSDLVVGKEMTELQGQYQLTSVVKLGGKQKDVFNFFSSPLNLGLLTPQWMKFKIREMPDRIVAGSHIRYSVGLWFIRLGWVTRIVQWEPDNKFVDLQEKGPYRLWWHEHLITSNDDGTVIMNDTVIYKIPYGIIGRIVHRLFIKKTLMRIFNFRNSIFSLRFQSD